MARTFRKARAMKARLARSSAPVSARGASLGAALVLAALVVPAAQAAPTVDVSNGITAQVPSCTPDGDVVVHLSYPGGLPSGTEVVMNGRRFKYQPGNGASSSLGATSGTVTFTKEELAIEALSNNAMSFSLLTTKGELFTSSAFSTTLCTGGAQPTTLNAWPRVTFAAPVCRGEDTVVPATITQPGDVSNAISMAVQDNALKFSGDLSAPAGTTHVVEVKVSRADGQPLVGSYPVYYGDLGASLPTA